MIDQPRFTLRLPGRPPLEVTVSDNAAFIYFAPDQQPASYCCGLPVTSTSSIISLVSDTNGEFLRTPLIDYFAHHPQTLALAQLANREREQHVAEFMVGERERDLADQRARLEQLNQECAELRRGIVMRGWEIPPSVDE
jgi:hypothetical protein